MDISRINLSLTQLYLEVARSVFTGIHHPEKKPKEQVLAEDGVDPLSGIAFSVVSVTVIYSYLALEAFANYHLYRIWEYSQVAHETLEDLKRKDPEVVKNTKPTYDDFYQKYGSIDQFENLKRTDLRDLDKRLKVICEALEIRKVHEVDVTL